MERGMSKRKCEEREEGRRRWNVESGRKRERRKVREIERGI